MQQRLYLKMISLSLSLVSGSCMITAMCPKKSNDDFFGQPQALGCIVAASMAVGLGACVEQSTLSPHVRAPVLAGLFLVGAYGTYWSQPPEQQSLTTTCVQTGAACLGAGYILKKLTLPPEHKTFIYTFFFGTSLFRLLRAYSRRKNEFPK